MPVVSEMVHPLSLDFANQRRVVMLRDVHKDSWPNIRKKVKNLKKKRPSKELVRRVYRDFKGKLGRRPYKYKNCGRKPWKVTAEVESFLVKRLLALRRESICTATVLQSEVARELNLDLDPSTIRKTLLSKGYRWMPRCQKRKYSNEEMKVRLAFAKRIVAMSNPQLKEKFALEMDGVILTMAPADELGRENYCRHGETHMYRKRNEAAAPELAGDDPYGDQVPLARSLPMWAGISENGFAVITFHPNKKIKSEEWAKAVNRGKLVKAIRQLRPVKKRGPWHILCDNEAFLRAPASRQAHGEAKVVLCKMPPRSPDLNPIERFWAWLRKRLRALELKDLKARRKRIGKTAFRARVRSVCGSAKAQTVAASCAAGLKKVCRLVVLKKGAASGK